MRGRPIQHLGNGVPPVAKSTGQEVRVCIVPSLNRAQDTLLFRAVEKVAQGLAFRRK